jgi:hypothetical protein
VGYLIAAYVVGIGGLVGYGAWLAWEQRRLRRALGESRIPRNPG